MAAVISRRLRCARGSLPFRLDGFGFGPHNPSKLRFGDRFGRVSHRCVERPPPQIFGPKFVAGGYDIPSPKDSKNHGGATGLTFDQTLGVTSGTEALGSPAGPQNPWCHSVQCHYVSNAPYVWVCVCAFLSLNIPCLVDP